MKITYEEQGYFMNTAKAKLDSTFYKDFLFTWAMLVFQNVITLSVNLADNMMLGAYSENALSGAATVNQIQFVYQMLISALGEGLVVFCSQYWGKRQIEPMKRIAAIAMYAGLLICLTLFSLVSLFPDQAIRLFTTDAVIIDEGKKYLSVIRFSYLFFVITQILLATLRSVGIVKIAFILSVQTFFINCGINYLLIYGKFGMPRLGVTGAAVGTLVARVVECGVLIVYVVRVEKNLRIRFADYLKWSKVLAKDYFRITSPILLTSGLWGVNTALQTAILGHMSSAAIAANSAASNLYLMVKTIPVGAGASASILIGKTIGEGNIELVKRYSKVLQKIFLCSGICAGVILYFVRVPVLSFYQLSEETKAMANTFLIILSIVAVGMSYEMPTNTGIIRGGGDSAFVVKLDLISIWGIVIPLSLFMAFIVKASPVVVVCCLNADQIFKCIPSFIKANYGNWIRKLTRDEITE